MSSATHSRATNARLLSGLFLLSVIAVPALASQEDVRIRASAGALYDSNRELNSQYNEEIGGSILRADVQTAHSTEWTSLVAGIKLADEYFRDDRELENDMKALSFSSDWRHERNTVTVDAELLNDTTLASEVQASGAVRERKERLKATLSAGYEFSVSETAQLLVGASAEAVDYDDIIPGQLAEYDYYGVNLGYGKACSSTTTLQAQLFANRMHNEDADYFSDVKGVRLVWAEKLGEASDIRASAGWRSTQYRRDLVLPAISNGVLILVPYEYVVEDEGTLYDLEWNYRGDYLRTRLAGSWNLVPDSGGNLTERYQLTGSGTLRWTARVSSAVNLMAWDQQSELERGSGNDTRGYQAMLSTDWRMARTWLLSARLQRFERELVDADERAHSNQLTVEFTWTDDPVPFRKQ